jgi:hypothetical protein
VKIRRITLLGFVLSLAGLLAAISAPGTGALVLIIAGMLVSGIAILTSAD